MWNLRIGEKGKLLVRAARIWTGPGTILFSTVKADERCLYKVEVSVAWVD